MKVLSALVYGLQPLSILAPEKVGNRTLVRCDSLLLVCFEETRINIILLPFKLSVSALVEDTRSKADGWRCRWKLRDLICLFALLKLPMLGMVPHTHTPSPQTNIPPSMDPDVWMSGMFGLGWALILPHLTDFACLISFSEVIWLLSLECCSLWWNHWVLVEQ